MQWTNGLPQRWEGCGELFYPDQPRYRKFQISGVEAARAMVDRFKEHPGYDARILAKVGWYDESIALAERAWQWAWANRGALSPEPILESAMAGLPPDRQVSLHELLVADAIDKARQAQTDGDGYRMHRAAFMFITLAKHVPAGSNAALFIRRVRESGVLNTKNLVKVLYHLRKTLVAERAYADALEGDPDPIGEFLSLASTSDLVTGVAGLFPSALMPAPSTATASQKWAIKVATLEMMHEDQRKEGIVLYEALVGAGRTADAERLKRELKSRYPVMAIPQGDSADDVALRRTLTDVLPPGDLDTRLREAEARAMGHAPANSG